MIMPLFDSVEAIKNIKILTIKINIIGLVNYLWNRSEILSPLLSMTSKQVKWNRSEI